MNIPPPILRTGLSDDVPSTRIDKHSALGKRLISTVFVLVNRAATTSAVYCQHAKRTQVTVADVQSALKYHAMTFLAEEGFEELEKDVVSMQGLVDEFVNEEANPSDVVDAFCDRSDGESDDESDGESVIEESDGESVIEESIEEEECSCEICTGVRSTDWDNWKPIDPAEQFIKKHVDEIITK
jgi:hypothetical protein